MGHWRLHLSGSQLDNLVKGPVCLTFCQGDLGQCALEFRTPREEENMYCTYFFLVCDGFPAALLCLITQLHHSPSCAWVNGAPYIGFSCCSSLTGWKGAVWGRPNGRVFKVGWFSGLSGTRRHNDHGSVWASPRCHSTEVAESRGSASLHSAWGRKWDAFTRPRFTVRVSEMEFTQPAVFWRRLEISEVCEKLGGKSRGPLFRCLPLLFMKCV